MKISKRDKDALAEAKVTRSRINMIDKMLDEGKTVDQMAEAMGLSPEQVQTYIDDYGLDWSE